jgi:hypothetical protein
MKGRELVREIKLQFVGERCWLIVDGQEYESRVVGHQCQFASIAPLDSSIPTVQFAWQTVNRIMRQDRLFRS